MRVVGFLFLIYVAAVARMMAGSTWGLVDISAIAVVMAVRCCSPAVAACLSFLMGLLVDGLSAGPFGAHAAAAVMMATVLSRWNLGVEVWSVGRWILAMFLMVCANSLVIAWEQGALSWPATEAERWLLGQAATGAATALLVGILVSAGRLVSGVACATR